MELICSEYKRDAKTYNRIDRILAIFMVIYFMTLLYAYGQSAFGDNNNLRFLIRIPSLILVIIPIIIILYLRKQSIESIGFNNNNLKKSLLLGTAFSLAILLLSLIIGLIQGRTFNDPSRLLKAIPYYLIEIGLTEEIIFRGYIQTRLFNLFKRSWMSIILVGFFFMIMHIPFQMQVNNMGLVEFVIFDWPHLLITFVLHIIINITYTKYNNIAAPTLIHFALNYSNKLFL